MIAIDTNVLVRVITKDDIVQARKAAQLLRGPGSFWVTRTVLLELGWVLESRYRYSRKDVSRALYLVVSVDSIVVEDEAHTKRALALHREGMDLGDAFIVSFAPPESTLVTFDRALASFEPSLEGLPSIRSVESQLLENNTAG